MKKKYVLLILILLCALFNVSAQTSVTVPDENKVYNIVNVRTLYYITALSEPASASWGMLYDAGFSERYSTEEERTRQQFKFIPVSGKDGKYYIQNVASEKYIAQATPSLDGNDWIAVWVDPSNIAAYGGKVEYLIISAGDGSVYIGNESFQNLLGIDYPEESYVKCSANTYSGYAPNYKWIITEYLAGNADKIALNFILGEVKEFLNNPAIQIGSEIGQYPQDIYDELLAKQAAAQDVFDDSEATQTEVDAVKGALEAIFKTFKESQIIMQPEAEKEYYVTYDGEVDTEGINSLDEKEDGSAFLNAIGNQKFKFEKVEVDDIVYYRIQSVNTGKYLCKVGGDGTKWTDNVVSEGDEALFRITGTGNAEKPTYVFFQVKSNGKYLGNDAGTSWGHNIYSNKDSDKAIYWQITAVNNLTNEGTATDIVLTGSWDSDTFNTIIGENAPSVTTIDFTNVTDLTELPSVAGLNPNCLIYVNEGLNVDGEDNVVVFNGEGAEASSVVLQDGYSFNNVKNFTADKISYTRPLSDDGWITVCLPFDVNQDDMILEEFADVETIAEDKDEMVFSKVASVKANVPYLAKRGKEIDNVIFEAMNAPVYSTENLSPVSSAAGYAYHANYRKIEGDDVVGFYLMNNAGTAFAKVAEGNLNGSYIPAFRAYFTATVNRMLSIVHDNGGATDINSTGNIDRLVIIPNSGSVEIISGKVQMINVYTLDGCLVRTLSLREGSNYVTGLDKGVYIINQQKVVII